VTETRLRLACEITAAGEALAMLPGELDITSSGSAFGYVRDVIDRHQMPVILNMAGLSFCDARGLTGPSQPVLYRAGGPDVPWPG
jgi:anti-anti-sigma regulatory factor